MRSFLEICHLNNLFRNTSIRHRIWFGFALILSILLFVSLSTLGQFTRLNGGISHVTEEIQPVVLTAQNLEARLETASNMLGFYLLTKEEGYQKAYSTQLDDAIKQASQLANFKLVIENKEYSDIIHSVQTDIKKLFAYKRKMITLAEDEVKNIPAQDIAANVLNPTAQQLQSLLSQMIESDYDEDNENGARDEFRRTLYDLRFYNSQMASELRTYLAFRKMSNVTNMRNIMGVIKPKLKYLQEHEDLYSFVQEDIMDNFIKRDKNYFVDLEKVYLPDKN